MVYLTLRLLNQKRCSREMIHLVQAHRCHLVYEGPPVVICCADHGEAAELVRAFGRSGSASVSTFELKDDRSPAAG